MALVFMCNRYAEPGAVRRGLGGPPVRCCWERTVQAARAHCRLAPARRGAPPARAVCGNGTFCSSQVGGPPPPRDGTPAASVGRKKADPARARPLPALSCWVSWARRRWRIAV